MTFARMIICGAVFAATTTTALADIDILSVTFTCDGNTQVPVSYFNASDGAGAAAMLIDGQLVAMRQAPSGSGIRYESEGGEGTYVLRSKGWNASISYQGEGSTAPEQLVYGDCTSK